MAKEERQIKISRDAVERAYAFLLILSDMAKKNSLFITRDGLLMLAQTKEELRQAIGRTARETAIRRNVI